MVIYSLVGGVPLEKWEAAAAAAAAGWTWPGGSHYATMDDGAWGVSGQEDRRWGGIRFDGRSGDPDYRIQAQVGGGTAGSVAYLVWRVTDWADQCPYVSPAEYRALLEELQGIVDGIAWIQSHPSDRPEWDHLQIAALELRKEVVEAAIRCYGGHVVVVYVGYAVRVGPGTYILKG
ncbi:MAG TPA: hypothetical protein DCQ64_12365 [Candidatus Rokubacteria bacterium]|nr:hypothetical protein [Candidatus Rokubacteria bacterium]